jgi:hypothetical protein
VRLSEFTEFLQNYAKKSTTAAKNWQNRATSPVRHKILQTSTPAKQQGLD